MVDVPKSPPIPSSFSEAPIAISTKPSRPASFADVAMRVAYDGPMYATIALVGVLALKGQASASEMVITALGALLARSWPRAVQVTGGGAVALAIVARAWLHLPQFGIP